MFLKQSSLYEVEIATTLVALEPTIAILSNS